MKRFRVSKKEYARAFSTVLRSEAPLPDHIELEGEEVESEFDLRLEQNEIIRKTYAKDFAPPTGEADRLRYHILNKPLFDLAKKEVGATLDRVFAVPPPPQKECEECFEECFAECGCPCHKREEKRHYDGGACDCVRPPQVEECKYPNKVNCGCSWKDHTSALLKVEELPEELNIPPSASDKYTLPDLIEMLGRKQNEVIRYLRSRDTRH